MIITIDGPSGTGKTTVARRVAEALGFVYFDTGAMYRAFTWLMLQRSIDIQNSQAVNHLLTEFDFNIVQEHGVKRYFANGHDVTEVIRSRPVTAFVSAVSALREVRNSLLHIQHQFALGHQVVFEGRDLGTVVFPDAEIKVFLNADPQVRAERRLNEMLEKNPDEAKTLSKEVLLADLIRRDEYDTSREVAPLRCPVDACCIDTTHLTIDEVVNQIVLHVRSRFPEIFVL